METIAVALIVGVVGPVIMATVTNRHRIAERAEDRADRAHVASEVVAVQEALTTSDAATAERLDALHSQATEIHTLVNSNMTAAMAGELAALKGQAVALRRLPGSEAEDIAELAKVEGRIAELQASIAERATGDRG